MVRTGASIASFKLKNFLFLYFYLFLYFWLCCVFVAVHNSGLITKSCPTLANPWTVALQAALSLGFSRQEYWSGLPFPSPEDLPDPGIEPRSPELQAECLPTKLGRNPFTQSTEAEINLARSC